MSGVLVNSLAIAVGACLGLLGKFLISEAVAKRIEQAMGFCTIVLGLKMALRFENIFVFIGALSLGFLLGSFLRIEERLYQLAAFVGKKAGRLGDHRFGAAFTTSTILYCTGAMGVVGSIQAGAFGDVELLHAKAIMDGSISASLAAIYGVGVAFSALPVLLYQGAIALAAGQLSALAAPALVAELNGVGGVMIFMIGLNLTSSKKFRWGITCRRFFWCLSGDWLRLSRAG